MKEFIRKDKIAKHIVSIMRNDEDCDNEEFKLWLKENPYAIETMNTLSDEKKIKTFLRNFGVASKEKSAQRLLKKIQNRQRRKIFFKASSVAAVLIVMFFIGVVSRYHIWDDNKILAFSVDNDIENVKLILESGEEVILDTKDVTPVKGQHFYKLSSSQIAVAPKKLENSAITFNRLVVPKRKSYSVILEDGTKVTLNAESEIVFPSRFTGERREVDIKGEAFFEVVKDSIRPFVVKVGSSVVTVYGTEFNVNYSNQSTVETFLLEGSVGVAFKNSAEVMLKPNQVISIDTNSGEHKIDIVNNSERYVGWVNNYFVFEGDEINEVIDELERWYNVELTIYSKLDYDAKISGLFTRDLDIKKILKSIETVSKVKIIFKDSNKI